MKKVYFLSILVFLTVACAEHTDQGSIHTHQVFESLTADKTGITFENTLTEGPATNILMYEYFYNGGGVATADFNNDGLIDIYFTSNMANNALYLNKGQMKFNDITAYSKVTGRPGPWKTGVNVVDINADGKMDIYLCYSGALPPEKRKNQLFVNQGNDPEGNPIFEEQAATYGLDHTGFSSQSYFIDYDRDGDLDMLLLNHNPKNLPLLNEKGTAELLQKDNPEIGLRVFQNTNNYYTDITTASGVNGSELSYGLGLGIADFNDDGWPDFYVSNDYAVPDYLYINNQNGTFTNQLANQIGHTSQFSMGNDVADVNNDGRFDIYTLDMLPEDNKRQKLLLAPDNYAKFDLNLRSGFYYQYMRNMLQLNNGDNSFSEVGQQYGIANTDWSWAALLADYDNDGWKDLFVSNGYLKDYTNLDFIKYMEDYVQQRGRLNRDDVREMISHMPASDVENYLFKNMKGNGFQKVSKEWGISGPSNSNGAAYADLDNDGDLDLVVNNINQPAGVFLNSTTAETPQHFLQIKLAGEAQNTLGLGSKVQLYSKSETQVLYQNPTRGYLSFVSPILHFGLGEITQIDSLKITWNSGKSQLVLNPKVDQLITLEEKNASEKLYRSKDQHPYFSENVITGLNFQHSSPKVNDFERQLLLNAAFSYSGPSMQKGDLNADGLADIVIGGGVGQAAALFIQLPDHSFKKLNVPAFEIDKAADDVAIAIFDANLDGNYDIYIGSGGYHQFKANDPLLADRLYLNDGKGGFLKSSGNLPKIYESIGTIKVIDINFDQKPDLFLGTRVIPGKYPETPTSYILVNDGKGNFSDKTQSYIPEIAKLGMLTATEWVDLNADKKEELVVVGEWTDIHIFSHKNGKWTDQKEVFLSQKYNGWWSSLLAEDFNGDGQKDLFIGNVGTNTQFKVSTDKPIELFSADFDQNGTIDPVLSFYFGGKRYPYITRDELLNQMPQFRPKYIDFKSYADVSLEELFSSSELKNAAHLSANYMKSLLLLSTPEHKLKAVELPQEVQNAPIYAATAVDANKDGKMDLIISGNNSHYKIRLGKFDANYGQLLINDGKGKFSYITQPRSGLHLNGDIRSSIFINNHLIFGRNNNSITTYLLN